MIVSIAFVSGGFHVMGVHVVIFVGTCRIRLSIQ